MTFVFYFYLCKPRDQTKKKKKNTKSGHCTRTVQYSTTLTTARPRYNGTLYTGNLAISNEPSRNFHPAPMKTVFSIRNFFKNLDSEREILGPWSPLQRGAAVCFAIPLLFSLRFWEGGIV